MNNLSVITKNTKNGVKDPVFELLEGGNLIYTWVSSMWGCCNEDLYMK
jgi:hypothetical protein